MKVLILGKNGQLGKSIKKIITLNQTNEEFLFIGREDLDLSSCKDIRNYFRYQSFDLVINCAAFTRVDFAEDEIESANQINHLAVSELAKVLTLKKTKLIHISTDYVFDGSLSLPYKEDDKVNPVNAYGDSKLKGEKAILKFMPTDAIIIRTSWLYSEFSTNFVKTILRLGEESTEVNVINDQRGSPTYATNLASVILKILQSNFMYKKYNTEIYHYSDAGHCTWHGFAKEIIRLSNLNCKLNPISSSQYPSKTKRPKNSVMDTSKITIDFQVQSINWKISLKNMLLNQ
jgi:dTDP-4-dehydrorhamnose reductase